MDPEMALRRARLTTPRAAAVAGVLFSVLLITALVLIRVSIPDSGKGSGDWLSSDWGAITLALNLVPFAGIAFLWFIGVVRARLGAYEDQLFSTVFLGSGLLFLAMLFASSALAGGIIIAYGGDQAGQGEAGSYAFARAVIFLTMNTYAMRMAGVFMISTSTIFVRTGVMPRWMALLGYALALILLLTITSFSWISLVFPLWVLMISVYILIENLGGNGEALPLPAQRQEDPS